MNTARRYRTHLCGNRFASFTIRVAESDLWIALSRDAYTADLPAETEQFLWQQRHTLVKALKAQPNLREALGPTLAHEPLPPVLAAMVRAGNTAGVGPMAAVAGALAEAVGCYLAAGASEVIVENGGDIFLLLHEPVTVGLHTGSSPFGNKLALRVASADTPLGICTSSATVGPSLSLGRADAAVVAAYPVALADAAATALGNMVAEPADFPAALAFASQLQGVRGALLVCRGQMAIQGALELVATPEFFPTGDKASTGIKE